MKVGKEGCRLRLTIHFSPLHPTSQEGPPSPGPGGQTLLWVALAAARPPVASVSAQRSDWFLENFQYSEGLLLSLRIQHNSNSATCWESLA